MSSPMSRVNEIISGKIGDYLTNVNTWGNVMYNALNNGLIGDGVTDDTADLQALVNTAIAAGRKAIYFPHTATGGQYFVTSITNGDKVVFLGDNASFVGGYTALITQLGLQDYTGMNRQAIINGNFDIWQRGTSFTNPANGVYTADRLVVAMTLDGGTNPTLIHSKQSLTPGDITNAFYYYRTNANGAGSGYGVNSLQWQAQKIENATRYLCGASKKVTVSFWARSDIAGKKFGVWLRQSYGTGGSPSASEVINGTNVSLTSTWTKYTFTFTTNTLVGKTFGTNNDDHIEVALSYQWGATLGSRVGASTLETFVGSGNIDIAQVQVCAGDAALPFQPKSFAQELQDCLRYYESNIPYGTAPADGALTGDSFGVLAQAQNTTLLTTTHIPFKVKKRISPTITLYRSSSGVTAGRWQYLVGGSGFVDFSATQTTFVNENGFKGDFTASSAAFTANNVYTVKGGYTADAEL